MCSFVCCVSFDHGVIYVICVICVLCLIVVLLPQGKNPFAVKIKIIINKISLTREPNDWTLRYCGINSLVLNINIHL
jgi:hypothetical protein